MTPERTAELTGWLSRHEQDIYRERNDYGDLKKVFKDVMGRDAGALPEKDVAARNDRIERAQSAVPLVGDPIFPADV